MLKQEVKVQCQKLRRKRRLEDNEPTMNIWKLKHSNQNDFAAYISTYIWLWNVFWILFPTDSIYSVEKESNMMDYCYRYF